MERKNGTLPTPKGIGFRARIKFMKQKSGLRIEQQEYVNLNQNTHTGMYSVLRLVFQGICLFCITVGFVEGMSSFLGIEISGGILAGKIALLCVAAVLGMSVPKLKYGIAVFFAGSIVFTGIVYQKLLLDGFRFLIQRFLDIYNQYFHTALYYDGMLSEGAVSIEPVFLFLAAILIFFCSLSICWSQSVWIPLIFVSAECSIIFIVGKVPHTGCTILMVFGLLGIWLLGKKQVLKPGQKADSIVFSQAFCQKIGVQKIVWVMGSAAVIVLLIGKTLLMPCFGWFERNRDLSQKIRVISVESAIDGWNMVSNPIWKPFSSQASMGISGGKIGDAASVKGTDAVDLIVTVYGEWDDSVYLKAFAASVYEGHCWEQIPDTAFDPSGISEDERKELRVQYEALGEMLAAKRRYEALSVIPGETIDLSIDDIFFIISGEPSLEEIDISVERKNANEKYEYIPYFSEMEGEEYSYYLNGWLESKESLPKKYQVIPAAPGEVLEALKDAELSGQLPDSADYPDYVDAYCKDYPEETLAQVKEAFFQEVNYDPDWSFTEVTRAICSYLHETAVYSTAPGKTPEDRDFVEYFLTEQKKGYCVHFATAAAILYRMCGYPARYAEGYLMSESEPYAAMEVKNNQAHAWVEVYHDAVGWIPVEVTPGFYQETEPPVESSEETGGESSEESIEETKESREPAVKPSREQNTEERPSDAAPAGSEGQKTPDEEKKALYFGILKTAGMVLLCIAAICAVIEIRSRTLLKRRKKQICHPVNRLSILNLYRLTCRMAFPMGIFMGAECDAEQMHSQAEFLETEQLEQWKKLVLEAYFSPRDMTEEEKRTVRDVYRAVYRTMQRQFLGRFLLKYVYCYPKP